MEFREEVHRRVGLVTFPYLFCVNCSSKTPIKYANVGSTKQQCAINLRSVLANKCVGGTHPSLDMLCTVMDLPPPIAEKAYLERARQVMSNCLLQASDSMLRAQKEVRELYDCDVGTGEIADILVSCDGTWQ